MKSYEEARDEAFAKRRDAPVGYGSVRDIYNSGFDDGKSFSEKQHTELNRQLANENFRLSEQIKKHEKTRFHLLSK